MLVHNITALQENFLEKINEKYILGGMIPDASIRKIYKNNSDIDTSDKTIDSGIANDKNPPKPDIDTKPDYDTIEGSNSILGDKVFKTQNEYNKYIYYNLKNGFEKGKETVIVSNNVLINNSFNHIANGMGFSLKQSYKMNNNGYNKIEIDFSIGQKFYTKEVYNKNEYKKNLDEVEKLIKKSNVLKLTSNSSKAKQFAKYLQFEFPYNNDLDNHLKSRSPYSITKYHTSVCEGYTYTFNQAMFLLNIPAYNVSGMSDRTPHMESEVYYNGKWNLINPTGFEKAGKEYFNNIYEMDDENIESMMTSMVNHSDTQNLIQRELFLFYTF